ncbi:MAG TPA: hypothetical protein VGQ25_12620 [Gemmatimonadales bacterium]|nr:hypothetical protein [Gemmatimonadales bacterium]
MRTSDRRVVRLIRLFGGGAAAIGAYVLIEILVRTGHLDAEAVAFTSMALALTTFADDVRRGVDVMLRVLLEGTPAPTDAQEVEMLEHLLAHDPPPEKEPLWAVRLAELYRTHLGQTGRADALLDRMLVKYPTSRELQVARRHS